MKKKLTISLLILYLSSIGLMSKEYTVDQKDKAFSLSSLSVKLGDVVIFRNSDPFFHNIYSLSPTKIFDLGSYKQGESKSVTFDKAGDVEVNCAIHPNMKMKVTVVK